MKEVIAIMKQISLLLVCTLVTLVLAAQDSSKTIKILNGRIQIEIPSGLHSMTAEEFQFKYHKPNTTNAAYSDKDLEANLLVSYQESVALTEDQLSEASTAMSSQMKSKNPNLKVLSQGIKLVNGHKYAFLKFTSQGSDQPIFNYQLYGSVDKKFLMFVFNCPEKMKADWDPKAEAMWSTIKQNK